MLPRVLLYQTVLSTLTKLEPKSVLTLYCVPNVLFLTSVVTLVCRGNGWSRSSCPIFGSFTGLEGILVDVKYWGGWSPPPSPPPAPTPLIESIKIYIFPLHGQIILYVVICDNLPIQDKKRLCPPSPPHSLRQGTYTPNSYSKAHA